MKIIDEISPNKIKSSLTKFSLEFDAISEHILITQAANTAEGKDIRKLLSEYPTVGVFTIENKKRIIKTPDITLESCWLRTLEIVKIGTKIAKRNSILNSLKFALFGDEIALLQNAEYRSVGYSSKRSIENSIPAKKAIPKFYPFFIWRAKPFRSGGNIKDRVLYWIIEMKLPKLDLSIF